jgi:hypothetical protein
MNMNGNIFIALLHSHEPAGAPLLVVAPSASPLLVLPTPVAEARAYAEGAPGPSASCF